MNGAQTDECWVFTMPRDLLVQHPSPTSKERPGKQNERNNDNNTESGDCDVLKMNGIQSLRALTGRVKLFE